MPLATLRRSGGDPAAGRAHFIGLPGNPVSSLITALVLLRPFVLALQGASVVQPPAHWLTADFEITQRDSRREFCACGAMQPGSWSCLPTRTRGC